MKVKRFSQALPFAFLLTACVSEPAVSSDLPKGSEVALWSPYSTQKIMRDRTYDRSGFTSTMHYEMAQNEIEGAQLILTPATDTHVTSFDVKLSDLHSGDAVISKDNIKVYLQKYVRIEKQINNNQSYGIGLMPDPLLPFDIAVAYGENKIDGVNQGIYVTVETNHDTVPGTYSGTCNININGLQDYEVPMEVKVWPFAISDEVHTRSLFDIWTFNGYMMNYELDASGEMMDLYSQALNEYRLSSTSLWIEDSGSLEQTITDFVAKALEATKNPKVSAFKFPLQYFEGYSDEFTKNRAKLFKACAKASTPDACIFDKMIAYFGALIDEPNIDTSRKPLVNPLVQSLTDSEELAISELESEGFFASLDPTYAAELKRKIRMMPNIVTSTYDSDYLDGKLTYCPMFDNFALESNRAIYADQKAKNGSLWWYGCVGPVYPYPTYHIDDHLLGARVLNWMAYDYGIDGNLYWCVNKADTHQTSNWDVVNYRTMNGDGYLFYPGINYGVKGPIGSLRLQTIRDGNEDYEYLYELANRTQSLSDYYGESISEKAMLQPIFNGMFTNAKYNTDNASFFALRKEVAALIENCSGEEKFVSKGIAYEDDKATLRFNVASGYDVKVNGKAVEGKPCGKGYQYASTITMDQNQNRFEIHLQKGDWGKDYLIDAGGKTMVVSRFDKEEDISSLKGNGDNVVITKVNADAWGGNVPAAKIVMESTFDPANPLSSLSYRPEFSLLLKDMNFNLNHLSSVKIRLYNDSGRSLPVSFLMKTSTGIENEMISTDLKEGWNTIVVDGIDKLNWSALPSVSRFLFRFNNTEKNENKVAMPLQTVYLSELIASYNSAEE